MFPEAQAHKTTHIRQLTDRCCLPSFEVWSGNGQTRIRKLWRRESEGTWWMGGEGQKPFFFFLKKGKDGFLWKNMLPSGDVEFLPCIGFIFPKIIGCT